MLSWLAFVKKKKEKKKKKTTGEKKQKKQGHSFHHISYCGGH